MDQTSTADGHSGSNNAASLDSRLDKISEWAKSVERIVEDARKALAEGREPPLPVLKLPAEMLSHPELAPVLGPAIFKPKMEKDTEELQNKQDELQNQNKAAGKL